MSVVPLAPVVSAISRVSLPGLGVLLFVLLAGHFPFNKIPTKTLGPGQHVSGW